VKRLVDGHKPAGSHKVAWDGTNDSGVRVSTGVYFYRLNAGSYVQTRKMLLLK
jgi:flagellar hook assembly protein FlgD